MQLSQLDVQRADLSFEPPLTKPSANRRIFLLTGTGVILERIKVSKKKGLTIPPALRIQNRPELEQDSSPSEQLLSDLTREVLAGRIREQMNKGVSPWPSYRDRQRD